MPSRFAMKSGMFVTPSFHISVSRFFRYSHNRPYPPTLSKSEHVVIGTKPQATQFAKLCLSTPAEKLIGQSSLYDCFHFSTSRNVITCKGAPLKYMIWSFGKNCR